MRILKDSALYLGGELFSKSIPFLLLPYLTRRLGTDGFGDMSYYQTILALLAIIVGLSQDGSVSRYFYFYGKRSINLVVLIGYFYTTIITLFMLIACWVINSSILAILVITSSFQSLFSTQLSILQCQKLVKQYITLQVFSAISSGVLTLCLLTFFYSSLVEKRFLALLLSNFTCVLFSLYIYRRNHNLKFKFTFYKYKVTFLYFFSFGFPLVFHQISGFLKGQLDRLLIYHQFTNAELGIYSAAFQIASSFSILLLALNKACVPYYYEKLRSGKLNRNKIIRLALYSIFIIPIPVLISLLIPEVWLVWFLGESYIGTKYFISLFLLGMSITIPYFILINYFFYHGRKYIITYSSIFSCILYIFSLYILSHLGIKYIPYSTVIANASIVIVLLFFIYFDGGKYGGGNKEF
ncbi:oligosaccharide flippase family protein [Pectobacterium fontis]|uniref:oligosaccharide flippase family protein n=1 Tax=Pectobacterium fontis TaxID=2558042 RepID=UPI00090794EE|nr:oligosaccharide flippase family protein [Pectobacterium fontis]